MIKPKVTNLIVMVLVCLMVVTLLCTTNKATGEELQYWENCLNSSNMTITDQQQLNQLQDDILNSSNPTKCIQLLLIGNSFELDLLLLTRIDSGILAIIGMNSVNIHCNTTTTNVTYLENKIKNLQPFSHAVLVLFDSLVFTKCPVPIIIEKVSNVIMQNCVFR